MIDARLASQQAGHACLDLSRKRVLFVTKTSEYGGAEIHLLQLIRGLRDSVLQLSVLCIEKDVFSERLDAGQSVEVIKCERPLESFRDWVLLFRGLQPGIDVAVFVYSWLWWFPVKAHVAARIAGIRKLYAIQHALPPAAPPRVRVNSLRDVLRRLVGKRARHLIRSKMTPKLWDKTVCVSDAVRNALIKDHKFAETKIVTVHNGVSLTEFAPSSVDGISIRRRLGFDANQFVLTCSTRLAEHKGVDVLLRGMAQAVRQGVSCKCMILGDGPQRDELLQQARETHLLGHVFFEGFQSDVRPYLHTSCAFILTSYTEGGGGPLSVLEAMACGLPCIVTGVGGSVEAITDRVNGLVIAPASPEAVADAISYLAAHPAERERMGRTARMTACERFNIDDRMAEIKLAILQ